MKMEKEPMQLISVANMTLLGSDVVSGNNCRKRYVSVKKLKPSMCSIVQKSEKGM